MSTILSISGVSYAYGDNRVIHDVSFSLAQGEMTALLGANGSGKTTLLRLAGNTLSPANGSIDLKGSDIRRYSRKELARTMAVLPQDIAMPPGWSVREAVSLGRTPYVPLLGTERTRDRRAVTEALETVRMSHHAESLFETLSGGQKQLVALAMTLAQEPDVLLLDEPTSHLDIKHSIELMDSVYDLCERRAITVFAAMHDPTLTALYFSRVILMRDGAIMADGTPREVLREDLLEMAYEAPVRVSWDEEMGIPVVNVLPARLRSGHRQPVT